MGLTSANNIYDLRAIDWWVGLGAGTCSSRVEFLGQVGDMLGPIGSGGHGLSAMLPYQPFKSKVPVAPPLDLIDRL